jgi:hypothetical protein
MRQYLIYIQGDSEKERRKGYIEAPNDRAAEIIAQQVLGRSGGELWDSDRLVNLFFTADTTLGHQARKTYRRESELYS